MRVDVACADFLEYCRLERQLSGNSLTAYRQDLDEFQRFFPNRLISRITGDMLVEYAQQLSAYRGLAPASVKRRTACLRARLSRLKRLNVIVSDPFADIDLRIRIPSRLPLCLSAPDVQLLLARSKACSTTYVAVLLLVTTGLRISELAAIHLGDIDLQQHTIRILGKGNRERQVFLSDSAVAEILRGYITAKHGARPGVSCRLLVNSRGRPATAACLRHQISKAARRAGVARHVTPHMLRHTAATTLIEAGVDIRFVQRLLGHRSITTTQIYTHVSDSALKGAIVAANVYRAMEG